MTELEGFKIDELIEMRPGLRLAKNWALVDKIRNYLDSQLVFIFDATWGHFMQIY